MVDWELGLVVAASPHLPDEYQLRYYMCVGEPERAEHDWLAGFVSLSYWSEAHFVSRAGLRRWAVAATVLVVDDCKLAAGEILAFAHWAGVSGSDLDILVHPGVLPFAKPGTLPPPTLGAREVWVPDGPMSEFGRRVGMRLAAYNATRDELSVADGPEPTIDELVAIFKAARLDVGAPDVIH